METSTPPLQTPQKNSSSTKTFSKKWKSHLVFYVFPILVLVIALWYGGYTRIFAVSSPYAPGATLDPDCAPGDPNCTVQVLPDQTSNGGKILSTNGTTTTWVTQTGGAFDGTQIISRTGLPGANTAAGAGGTTLQDFIQNYFFPATPPAAGLSGGGTRELGASASWTLSWSATKNTYSITGISITANNGGSVCGRSGGGSIAATGPGCGVTVTGNTQSGTAASVVTTASTQVTGGSGTTFTITVTPSTGSAVSATTAMTYLPKVYAFATSYDYIVNPSSISDSALSTDFLSTTNATSCGSLPCSLLTASSARTISAPSLSAQFFYYAIPATFTAIPYSSSSTGFIVNGFHNNGWGERTVSFTNGSGYTQNYYVYQYQTLVTGALTVVSP